MQAAQGSALHDFESREEGSTGLYGSMMADKYIGSFNKQHNLSGNISMTQSMTGIRQVQKRHDPAIREGEDHFKNLFTFIQRKVEYENYRFKHPTLLAVVIESINTRITDKQRMFTGLYFRYHMSQDLTISDLAEVIKFKLNARIDNNNDKISKKDKVIFFNDNTSVSSQAMLRDQYVQRREDDGWLYLDFLIEGEM